MMRPEKKLKPSPDPRPPPTNNGVVSNQSHDQSPIRRWEDLDVDCLANVFAKVGMESLLLSLSFVCKSWYAVSHNPLCWKVLSFPDFEPYPLFASVHEIDFETLKFGPFYDKFVNEYNVNRTRFTITGFIKLVVSRSNGKATYLKLPGFCNEEALRYVSDACPELRMLLLCDDLLLFKHSHVVSELIGKWKHLEHLTLGGNCGEIVKQYGGSGEYLSKYFEGLLAFNEFTNENLHRIVVQLGVHCKRFMSLHVFETVVGEAEASAIVTMLPGLMDLTLGHCWIERDTLVMILKGCKKVGAFNLWYCEGFEGCDEEMLKLASHIRDFWYNGAPNDFTSLNVLKRIILTMGIKNQIWRKGKLLLARISELDE
ncbi:F-box/LRR-repeat protein At3g48880-like [Argentina anserina]|uniref:F-box/LRR-repeat protein At3g48880-like n=1 Tax=Argentina anserina TaxID=57926 RepID=UPI00217674BB|nr:F-box/LRR-repeat protein At3g48880-like [Potentilla anserina]